MRANQRTRVEMTHKGALLGTRGGGGGSATHSDSPPPSRVAASANTFSFRMLSSAGKSVENTYSAAAGRTDAVAVAAAAVEDGEGDATTATPAATRATPKSCGAA